VLVNFALESLEETRQRHAPFGIVGRTAIDTDGPRGHVVVADDEDVGNLLEFGRTIREPSGSLAASTRERTPRWLNNVATS
jgi:hypothetical protein